MPHPPSLARFGAIGDIHTEHRILERVLDFLAAHQPPLDAILAVGDIVDGFGDPQRTCDLLIDAGVLCVRGNHDRWFGDDIERNVPESTHRIAVDARAARFLDTLPPTRDLPTIAGPLLLCHGLDHHDTIRLAANEDGQHPELRDLIDAGHIRFVVNGHTHRAMVRNFGGLTLLNPGTLHRNHAATFLLVDLEARLATLYRVADDAITVERIHELS